MRLQTSLLKPRKPRLFLLRRVMGDSMLPTLTPGTIVLAVRPRAIRPGDIVVVHHDNLDKIKRVKEIRAGEIFLTGDNSLHSSDSRDFGWLGLNSELAKVVWPRIAA